MESKEIKLKIIAAGRKAVKELIKVAEEDIIRKNLTTSPLSLPQIG